ncbi:MAG: hypothetical protein CYPHOPRED_006054 [Cyphobasidiales sp. Tagirdzhanova-0007]|nr:MAG: hypothetical protein CYPHOPRED_006054 [Cyphobasidiales sp. Tagirdzhanova-0007]
MSEGTSNGHTHLKRPRSSSTSDQGSSDPSVGKKLNIGNTSPNNGTATSQPGSLSGSGPGNDAAPASGAVATSMDVVSPSSQGEEGVTHQGNGGNLETNGTAPPAPSDPEPAPATTVAATEVAPTITIRALIVTQDASIIIGKAGSHIKEIREKAGAKVSVSEQIIGNPERILHVSGPLDAAYGLIVRKINDEPYDVPSVPGSRAVTIKYIVPNNRMGSVIGKGGSKIKEIQEASGARLQASESMLPGSTERILSVSGVADAVHIAVYYVGTILQETPERGSANTAYRPSGSAGGGGGGYGGPPPNSYVPSASTSGGSRYGGPPPPASSSYYYGQQAPHYGGGGGMHGHGHGGPPPYGAPPVGAAPSTAPAPGSQTQQIYIPNELVGNIIGKGGQKINEIRQLSGCSIKIMELTESQGGGARPNERLVTITGLPPNIQTAVQMLHARLEQEKTKKSMPALPEQHECILDENKPLIKQEPLLTSTFKELLPDRSKRTQSELSPEETEKDKKKQAALTILHKNFPATIPLSQNASSSKPVKALSKATMLIKLKQRAKAGDTGRAERQILPKHRRYLLASVFRSEKCIEVWLPDDTACGKALDLLAYMLGVSNRNNLASIKEDERLHLAKSANAEQEGRLAVLLNSAHLGTEIADGDEVYIITGADLKQLEGL